jgi:methanobactin biosynthesis MbnP-like protein
LTKRVLILSALVFLSVCSSYAQHSKGMLSIAFEHFVDDTKLILDTVIYKNASGQTYSISKFKYYISNVNLRRTDGIQILVPGYFLIDEEDENSKKVVLKNISPGEYISVSFMIGVDSTKNCSGAQSGALDPVNGMFWTWNTGYIFLKLEGKAAASSAPGKIIEYHIGGYRQPDNAIRTALLQLPSPIKINTSQIASLKINVNAAEVLRTPHEINFSKNPSVTESRNAMTIADNYSDMFSLETGQ